MEYAWDVIRVLLLVLMVINAVGLFYAGGREKQILLLTRELAEEKEKMKRLKRRYPEFNFIE